MSHLGLKKTKRHHWEAVAPTTSDFLVRILVEWHHWGIFLRKWRRSRAVTVNWERYRVRLNEFLFLKIEEDDMDDIFFSTERSHTANVRIDLLRTVFKKRIISRNSDVNWPPRSCDLTPLDFFYVEPLRISVTLTIQRRLRPWNTKSKLPFMGLKPKQSKMYWKIGLIEWGSVNGCSHLNDVAFHS